MNEEITASYLLTTDAMLPALRWHQQKLLLTLWWPVLSVIMVFNHRFLELIAAKTKHSKIGGIP